MPPIYLCPADKRHKCAWEGHASQIRHHVQQNHPQIYHASNSIQINLENNTENHLLAYQNEIYLFRSTILANNLTIKLHYLGGEMIAFKKQYVVNVTVNSSWYLILQSDPVSYITATNQGYNIDLNGLEQDYGGKIFDFVVTIVIEDSTTKSTNIKRNNSSIRYRKQSPTYRTRYEEYHKNGGDLMDNISLLNFSILEEPFGDDEDSDKRLSITSDTDFMCTNCKTLMSLPIFICHNGHNICEKCRAQECLNCKGFVTNYRNAELEELAKSHMYPCKFALQGCTEKLLYSGLHQHVSQCQYCTYRCQMDQCSFEGTLVKFGAHLRNLHFSVRVSKALSNEFRKNVEFYIVHERVGVFFCKSIAIGETITWEVTFCGPKEKKFCCELMFKKSKLKEPIFLHLHDNIYAHKDNLGRLKKERAKDKDAVLIITPMMC